MPKFRFSAAEVAAIQARFAAGDSVAAVAASLGRSRQSLARIKGAMDRHQARRLDVKLNIRITQGERAAFQAVADASGLTVSEAIRHLIKQASGLLALQADELAAISAARRELAAVGNNLNQLARLGASGKLNWKSGDTGLLRRVAARVDEVSEGIVLLLSAHDSHQTLRVGAAVATVSGQTAPSGASP
ncbi:MAG TPA: hypothetical protein VF982_07145 [Anaerolineales bacterium]